MKNDSDSSQLLARYWKPGLSLLLVLHLLAVVAEPFRFFTLSSRGTSPAADPLRAWLAPYVELAYLNHGYFFFAPEPGPSHLMECRLEFADGQAGNLRFPDKHVQRPRLFYHRHFMLAEFLHQLHWPPVDVTEGDPRVLADWRADRRRFEMVRDSMQRHVKARYAAHSVEIRRVEHRLPSSNEVLVDRVPLDDPTLFVTLPDAPLLVDMDELPARGSDLLGTAAEPTPPADYKPLREPTIEEVSP